VKTILKNSEELYHIDFYNINKSSEMVKYIEETYPENCVSSGSVRTCKLLPVKASQVRPLSDLEDFRYLSKIEYLAVAIKNLNLPFSGGWQDYQTLFALCPKLKVVCLQTLNKGKWVDVDAVLHKIPEKNQNIWKQRISYLNSRGIKVTILCKEYADIVKRDVWKKGKGMFRFFL
jgi:hypothetical protein